MEIFDLYGLTELWGPGTGIECHRHDGMHVRSDHFLVEIIDPTPSSRSPTARRGAGRDHFGKQATPLLRCRTRTCRAAAASGRACGSPYPRIGRITGRTDDAIKVRGVMVLPAQVDLVLAEFGEQTSGEYQLHVTRDGGGRDELTLTVEADGPASLAQAVAARLRAVTGLRFDVELAGVGTLPRSARKARRVFDHRDGNE